RRPAGGSSRGAGRCLGRPGHRTARAAGPARGLGADRPRGRRAPARGRRVGQPADRRTALPEPLQREIPPGAHVLPTRGQPSWRGGGGGPPQGTDLRVEETRSARGVFRGSPLVVVVLARVVVLVATRASLPVKFRLQRRKVGLRRVVLQLAGNLRLLRLCSAAPHGVTPSLR